MIKNDKLEKVPIGWTITKVKDVAVINPETITRENNTKEIRYIDISSVKTRELVETTVINIDKAPSRAKRKVKDGDTIISTVRVYRKSYLYLKNPSENTIVSTGFAVIRPKCADKKFLHYYLTSDKFINYLTIHSTGSAYPAVDPSLIGESDILLPPAGEQLAIGEILFNLDEKISLNRQMNSTLEAIGQALFKHWFVDFEFPNEEGKPYRSSGGEMVDSELGEVPKGWNVGMLGDICEIIMGQSPPGTTYNETGDGLPFYQGVTDFGFRFPSRRVYCMAPTRFANEGDVLLSVRAPVGSLNVADERCAIGRGVAALRMKGKQHRFLYYLLCATQSGWNKFEAEGTVFGSVNKSDVHAFKIILPLDFLRNRFGSLIEPLDEQIITNEKQTRTLATIRDALLPKLMSGLIRVPVEIKV